MADWTVGAARDLPIVAGDWDGAAAQKRLFGDGEEIDQERARRGHLVYDAERPGLKGSYKLPFSDVRDGRLVAVTGGLNAAASRLPQTDIPPDVRDKARAVLDAYREKRQQELVFHDVMLISEFRGKYPDVPFAEGVDYAALVAGDADPVFVTLPIGKANVTSGNKRYYDDAFVSELERQVLANRPVGLMGHLKPEQRATEFPMEAVHWVGAKRIGELLWGKGYIPAGDARARLLRYKATNKQIATSIDALAEGVWDEGLGAYRMSASSLRLNQIDIAPADRAGIGDLATVPHITTEMVTANLRAIDKESEVDRDEVIKSLTLAEVPTPLRDAIAAGAVQELRSQLGLSDDADIVARVREMQAAETQRQQENVTRRIQELIEDKDNGIRLESARGLIVELVQARQPQSIESAEAAYQAVVGSDSVKALLAAQVQEMMGPRQTMPVAKQNGKNVSSQWWDDAPTGEA